MNVLMAVLAASVIGGLDHNIVTPQWLEQNLDDPYVVVVEIGDSPTLDHPHVPGARFVPFSSIVRNDGWPPDELPSVADLRRAFESAGVGDSGRIVLYSEAPLQATRAWFTLDYLGQGDRTAILDGGFRRWVAEKRPVATRRAPHLPATFTPAVDAERVVSLEQMRDAAAGRAVLIDARSAYEFHGFRRGANVTRRGHIPGAECEPAASNYDRNGSFLPAAALNAKYERIAPDKSRPVVVYCRTGVEASATYFVLRSLGYDVALHDGSFAEWSRDRSLPVAKLSQRR